MKTYKLLLAPLALLLLMCTGCENANRISESKIESLVTDELAGDRSLYVNARIKTGYYEENDDDARYTLRQLAAAGVITYEAERIQKQVRYKSGYSFDSRTYRIVDTYSTYTQNKYFVNVALTDEGKLLTSLDANPTKEVEDKYLLPAERESYPEDEVPVEETFPGDEQPSAEQASTAESATGNSASGTSSPEPKTDYDKAKARESFQNEIVKAYKVKVVDVRNIVVNDGQAHAQFVLEVYDATPAGRIISNKYQGRHGLGKADFVYFQDKGWVLSDMDSPEYYY